MHVHLRETIKYEFGLCTTIYIIQGRREYSCIFFFFSFAFRITKVDRDDAYVTMLYTYVASFCSQCFIYFFRFMLQVCLFGCYIYFTHILQVFYLGVAYVLQWFQVFV
jgi:hypothetical protein